MRGKLEKITKEFLILVKMKPLSEEDVARAKTLKKKFKEIGFTNREIRELTDCRWSVASIKLYAKGSTVKNPEPNENVVKLLTQLTAMNLNPQRR